MFVLHDASCAPPLRVRWKDERAFPIKSEVVDFIHNPQLLVRYVAFRYLVRKVKSWRAH